MNKLGEFIMARRKRSRKKIQKPYKSISHTQPSNNRRIKRVLYTILIGVLIVLISTTILKAAELYFQLQMNGEKEDYNRKMIEKLQNQVSTIGKEIGNIKGQIKVIIKDIDSVKTEVKSYIQMGTFLQPETQIFHNSLSNRENHLTSLLGALEILELQYYSVLDTINLLSKEYKHKHNYFLSIIPLQDEANIETMSARIDNLMGINEVIVDKITNIKGDLNTTLEDISIIEEIKGSLTTDKPIVTKPKYVVDQFEKQLSDMASYSQLLASSDTNIYGRKQTNNNIEDSDTISLTIESAPLKHFLEHSLNYQIIPKMSDFQVPQLSFNYKPIEDSLIETRIKPNLESPNSTYSPFWIMREGESYIDNSTGKLYSIAAYEVYPDSNESFEKVRDIALINLKYEYLRYLSKCNYNLENPDLIFVKKIIPIITYETYRKRLYYIRLSLNISELENILKNLNNEKNWLVIASQRE